jgi:hypothetical protein
MTERAWPAAVIESVLSPGVSVPRPASLPPELLDAPELPELLDVPELPELLDVPELPDELAPDDPEPPLLELLPEPLELDPPELLDPPFCVSLFPVHARSRRGRAQRIDARI